MCCVDNPDGQERKEAVIWIIQKDMVCTVLQMAVVNCQKRVVDFLEGLVNLIKMHLSLISYEFLICDMHMQLLGETLWLETLPQNLLNY